MRILELFSGTESISNVFRERGHSAFTVEIDPEFNPSFCGDVRDLNSVLLNFMFPDIDMVWASPVCDTYSVSALGRHRNYTEPKTDKAREWDGILVHVLNLIREIGPKIWIIENPVGMLRKMPFMQGIPRRTVTYCQYGENRQKPTDLFGNRILDFDLKQPCKKGSPCHEYSPRGSRRGTQRLTNSRDRSRIPKELCFDICKNSELILNGKKSYQAVLL